MGHGANAELFGRIKMIAEVLNQLVAGEDLSSAQMEAVMDRMLAGELDECQIAGFLMALRCKGETVIEIGAAARVMRRHAKGLSVPPDLPLLDTCGTGGDGANTFNISTAAALVAAAGGATVAKHGNRSVSSKSGSADVLEALGVSLDCTADRLSEILLEVGIAFLFAPAHHAATRHAVGPRRALGVRTLFNVLGPLTNPAGAQHQVMGVFSPDLVEPIGQVLADLGAKHALVVHGAGGLDEFSLEGPNLVSEIQNGSCQTYLFNPEEAGLMGAPVSALGGGEARDNAKILRAIFDGEVSPRSDAVAFNAGAALYAADRADSIADGVVQAQALLANGRVQSKLNALVEASQQ
jgi:anthranilate phosphoribosyltransferase